MSAATVEHPTTTEAVGRGQAGRRAPPRAGHARPGAVEVGTPARRACPRSDLAGWPVPPDRRDPVVVLAEQDATRVPELVPIRHGRMLVSAFTFYRGAAAIMAADLAGTPDSG